MNINRRMHVLINCSNLHVGGAVAVATSFIRSLSLKDNLEFDVSILTSTKVMNNLNELDVDFSRFKTVAVFDFLGIEALWSGMSRHLTGYELVFTVFGPAYSIYKVNKHLVGFAQPSIIYPKSRAFFKVPFLKRVLLRLKLKVQEYFFAQADALVVELNHVKVGLERKSSFRGKDIYVVNSAVDSVFTEPSRWVSIDSTMEFKKVLKLGVISRNYVHKNLDILPYIKQSLKSEHDLDAEFFVTFVPEEWNRCSEFFRSNINNVGPLTLAQCPTFYNSLDGVVFPSLLECFSAVPIESMLMEKPLFAADLPFIKDCCKVYANYFKSEDCRSAAAVIAEYFLKTSDEQADFVGQARRFVSSYPSAEDRAESYLSLIRHELHG
ncbi:glycosyltransferase [Pseudomonas sp. D3]|uniref:glycosyltransferase n=1 Tax=Pseudomonas sp. D3 TaxID=517398 RepID=UPI0023E3528B|nr:glycosyltransferase [Pseudomonas sp. D3]WET12364.1 glycosyltransferase [Pseudomonas sp. D3]